ncbi:MAG: DUF4331 domain-containing protein [Gammaproteobacteria bacterium]
MRLHSLFTATATALACALPYGAALASSHREAPFITTAPKVDGTDFYLFNSYETGRTGFVTLIANYLPLQDAYGGPNYFTLDPDALYEIHIDNTGDAVEDITFQFRFQNQLKGIALQVGPDGSKQSVPIPLVNAGAISADPTSGDAALNVIETYTVTRVDGDRRSGVRRTASAPLRKPTDNIGNKSIPDYPGLAAARIHEISIPGCTTPARVFVGQRKEGFVVNLGETFDLVNIAAPAEALDPNARNLELNTIADKNVTSIALEIAASCLTGTAMNTAGTGPNTTIGGWTTASLRQARVLNAAPQNAVGIVDTGTTGSAIQGGAWTQVSRLGMPLVNEVVIGLPDKDRFNASEPKDDGQFATYVTNPTLPELLEILFGGAGVVAPDLFPRSDLVTAFLTGIEGVNQLPTVTASEMLRLNTGIPATPAGSQNDLGALECFVDGVLVIEGNAACDPAGFPNGRRPVDDVVDIELRVAMGELLPDTVDPRPESVDSRKFGYTDGARPNPNDYKVVFPYLADPIPGSPAN